MIMAMRLDFLLKDEGVRQRRAETELILIASDLVPVVHLQYGQSQRFFGVGHGDPYNVKLIITYYISQNPPTLLTLYLYFLRG